ncbi:MAG TPA: peptidyl-prolyl cis-trans isomerase [Solirubrobacteraceae bacterium]|nr:peptidyl-prolyl cis-trans isomerase [Solirubrobacteraceae bacterium]
MTLHKRTALAAAALSAVAIGVTACGGGAIPGNSVATVGDQTIKRDTFDHWMKIIAISTAAQTNPNAAKTATVPDAPDFKQCIAQAKKTAAKPAKGQPEPTDAQFKSQCQQQYSQFKTEVLGFLIRSTWLDQEATKQKVSITDKELQKQIDDIKKQQFTQKGSYEKFLQNAGLTNEDVLFQQRVQQLQNKITAKITKGKDNVTDAQIQAYYNKNQSRFASPERRDLRIVLTKQKAQAEQAKKALQSGQSWKSVAKKYSIDTASKSNGGSLPGVAKGQQEKALDTAVFAADKGKLSGPIKTQFGWYVFEVAKVTKAKQQSLEESKASIKQILQQQGQQNALKKFGDDYRKRYKAETDCRKGYQVDDCKNAPKQAATTSTQQQQQAPQPPPSTTSTTP